MASEPDHILIILTSGDSPTECSRAAVAFTLAVSLLSLGKKVSIYFTSDGVKWARETQREGPMCEGFPTLDLLLRQFFREGGDGFVCSVCLKNRCTLEESSAEALQALLIEPFKVGGIASAAALIVKGAQVVTF